MKLRENNAEEEDNLTLKSIQRWWNIELYLVCPNLVNWMQMMKLNVVNSIYWLLNIIYWLMSEFLSLTRNAGINELIS